GRRGPAGRGARRLLRGRPGLGRAGTPPTGYHCPMRFRIGLALGLAVGYYLGTGADPERRRQLNSLFSRLQRSESMETATVKARAVVDLGVERARDIVESHLPDPPSVKDALAYSSSRESRSRALRMGWRSLARVLDSIWRMRSRVTPNSLPTSSRVRMWPSSRPKRRRTTFCSRSDSSANAWLTASLSIARVAASEGAMAPSSSMRSDKLKSSSPIG